MSGATIPSGVDQSQEPQIHQVSQKTKFESGLMGTFLWALWLVLSYRPAAKIPIQILSPTSWYHFALCGGSRPLSRPALALQLCPVFRVLSLVMTHCHSLDVLMDYSLGSQSFLRIPFLSANLRLCFVLYAWGSAFCVLLPNFSMNYWGKFC